MIQIGIQWGIRFTSLLCCTRHWLRYWPKRLMHKIPGIIIWIIKYTCKGGTPTNELLRFDNNTLTYLSPATKCIQQDIAGNSAWKISLNTSKTLRESRKSILYNIDWLIQQGMTEDNAQATEIFHEMEKYVQKCKLKLQETILLEKNKGRHLGK